MQPDKRVTSGITNLDIILKDGFIPKRNYLIKGKPGTGKTILGLHFLDRKNQKDVDALFISFEESEKQVRSNGSNLGFDMDNIEFLDLSPKSQFFKESKNYSIFSSEEVEQDPINDRIKRAIEDIKPERIFIDSISQFRFLTNDEYQFHKQVLSLMRYLKEEDTTALFSSEASQDNADDDLQFLSDGIILLEKEEKIRHIEVQKFRGSDFHSGKHSMKITDNGIKIFPVFLSKNTERKSLGNKLSSGIPEIDQLLKGGIESSTTTLISGPSGVGKTTLAIQFMKAAAGRGETSIIYAFDENEQTIVKRCSSINIPIDKMIQKGSLSIHQIEPLQYTPEEFFHTVKKEVNEKNAEIVMIDSLSGYKLSLSKKRDISKMMHILNRSLNRMGISTILTNEIHELTGDFKISDIDISYLADTIIFLRYLEIKGQIRKALGILKNRLSNFERNLREFEITKYGIKVGEPLNKLRGILQGTPEFIEKEE